MFPFTYTFEREIIGDKTSDQVIYAVHDLLKEKNIQNILCGPEFISFSEGLFTERSNWHYLSLIDNGKFTYHENNKTLTYEVKLWKLNLFSLIFFIITMASFKNFFGNLFPFSALLINHLLCYFGNRGLIKKIVHKINYLS
ncbi:MULTISPECIES: hypothetical protein [unclassified Chryseobacterium]|uniref:hypothetical protein n=1 Tax=unclassified Chryseobacterium TaxID=2593645 RepID=UPI001AEB8CB5|nr:MULTISPECIES: hypothetical protein [unclassified Chryseobacterium]MBP1163418.1 hypothetical protein [Chryseobacterium sp. PvR013]MDR4894385.1 hypothetical protein [Chryseobacterium sp. CFS7]